MSLNLADPCFLICGLDCFYTGSAKNYGSCPLDKMLSSGYLANPCLCIWTTNCIHWLAVHWISSCPVDNLIQWITLSSILNNRALTEIILDIGIRKWIQNDLNKICIPTKQMGVKTNRTSLSREYQTPQHSTKNVKKCNLRTWMQQVKVRKIYLLILIWWNKDVLLNLKPYKTVGDDRISHNMLTHTSSTVCKRLQIIFIHSLQTGDSHICGNYLCLLFCLKRASNSILQKIDQFPGCVGKVFERISIMLW